MNTRRQELLSEVLENIESLAHNSCLRINVIDGPGDMVEGIENARLSMLQAAKKMTARELDGFLVLMPVGCVNVNDEMSR